LKRIIESGELIIWFSYISLLWLMVIETVCPSPSGIWQKGYISLLWLMVIETTKSRASQLFPDFVTSAFYG